MAMAILAAASSVVAAAAATAICAARRARARSRILSGDSLQESNPQEGQGADEVVLYLIRHGEAIHNVQEKTAKRNSGRMLDTLGLNPGDETYEEIVEGARVAVLHDDTFKDAPLSSSGVHEAKLARECIQDCICKRGIPEPEVVFVSPLERALKTAAIVFAGHPSVQVVNELRERQTGLPCDQKKPSELMKRRSTFENMVWDWIHDSNSGADSDTDTGSGNNGTESGCGCVEDKAAVRARCREAMNMLTSVGRSSIAVVSHKGWLRELERGIFGQSNATEFANCEVRIYKLRRKANGRWVANRIWGTGEK